MIRHTDKLIERVAFFGDADAQSNEKPFVDAVETAKLLAENGYIIVNGGGPGIMLASTLGAKMGGGRVEVVTLKPDKVPENFEGECKKNTDLADKRYEMANYDNRLNKLVAVADAFVVFFGGTGTLAEMGLTWSIAKFDYGHHEPLIFFGPEWKKIIKDLVVDLKLEKKEQEVVTCVKKPEEVLDFLRKVSQITNSKKTYWRLKTG